MREKFKCVIEMGFLYVHREAQRLGGEFLMRILGASPAPHWVDDKIQLSKFFLKIFMGLRENFFLLEWL